MKNIVKIPLIIAGVLIGLGVIIIAVGFAVGGTSWLFGSSKMEDKTVEIKDSFDSIKVETDSIDVRFAPAQDGNCRVEAHLSDTMSFTAEVKNNTLTISCKDRRHWYQFINFHSFDGKMTVYLPEGAYSSLKLTSASGNIQISDCASFGFVDITTASGDVAASANGIESLSVSTASGDVLYDSQKSSATIQLNTASGDIELKNVSCKNLKIHSVSGEVSLSRTVCSDKLAINTTSGDVDLSACDAEEITVNSVSGDVSGSLLSDKVFSAHSVSGDVRVPQDGNGGKCAIKTTSGDISIRISG